MCLLVDPCYLMNLQFSRRYLYKLTVIYAQYDSQEDNQSIIDTSLNLLAIFDSYIYLLNNIHRIKEHHNDDTADTSLDYLVKFLKYCIRPCLWMQNQQIDRLYQLLEQLDNATDNPEQLTSFLNVFDESVYKDLLMNKRLTNFLQQQTPATVHLLTNLFNIKIVELNNLEPLEYYHSNPDMLERLIQLYRTIQAIFEFLKTSHQYKVVYKDVLADYNECRQTQLHTPSKLLNTAYDQAQDVIENYYAKLERFLDDSYGSTEKLFDLNSVPDWLEGYLQHMGVLDADYNLLKPCYSDNNAQFNETLVVAFYHYFLSCLYYNQVIRTQLHHDHYDATQIFQKNLYKAFEYIDQICHFLGFNQSQLKPEGEHILLSPLGQKVLLLLLLSDYILHEQLLPDPTSSAIAHHLYNSFYIDDDTKMIVDYLYYQRKQQSLAKSNALTHFERFFPIMVQGSYSIKQLSDFINQKTLFVYHEYDNYFMERLKRWLNVGVFLTCLSYLFSYRPLEQINEFLLQVRIDQYVMDYDHVNQFGLECNLTLNLIYAQNWLYCNILLDFFHQHQWSANLNKQLDVFQTIQQQLQSRPLNNRITTKQQHKVVSELLLINDHILAMNLNSLAANHSNGAERIIPSPSIDTFIEEHITPLLTILSHNRQNFRAPLQLMQFLQTINQASDKAGLLDQFNYAQWYFDQAVIDFYKQYLPHLIPYITTTLWHQLSTLYSQYPPEKATSQQALQITALFKLCSYLTHYFGQSLDDDFVYLENHFNKYQPYVLQQSDWTDDNESKSDNRKKKSRKKNKRKKPASASSSNLISATGNILTTHSPAATPNSTVTAAATHQEQDTSNELSSSLSKLSTQPTTQYPDRAVDSISDHATSACSVTAPNHEANINLTDLPELLHHVAYQLYFNSKRCVQSALTGGAITALYRGEQDKIRDYDCLAVADNIDEIKELLLADITQGSQSSIFVGGNDPDSSLAIYRVDAKHPLLVVQENGCRIEIKATPLAHEQVADQCFYQQVTHNLSMDNALYVNLSDLLLQGTQPIKGLKGALEAIDHNKLKLVLPPNHTIQSRLLEDPSRLVRLVKIKLTYPSLQPNKRLTNHIASFCDHPERSGQLVEQAALHQKQLGTVIQDLFKKFTVEQTIQGLLDDQLPVLAALTGLDHNKLKACQNTWLEYIKIAKYHPDSNEYAYKKKLHLFHCLLATACVSQPDKPTTECDLTTFYDIKTRHIKSMSYIKSHIHTSTQKHYDLYIPSLHHLITNIKEQLQPKISSNPYSAMADISTHTQSSSTNSEITHNIHPAK